MASLADLDLRHHVPDELQIYLYHCDPRLISAPGHGNGHMRLGLLAEIDRAKVHLASSGLEEFGSREKSAWLPTTSLPRRETRNLFARRIQLADLGDGRDLAQKPEIVEAALVQHRLRSARLGPGGPINLVLDLRDKLLDLGGRGSAVARCRRTRAVLCS